MKKTALVAALAVAMMFGIVASAHAATGTVVIQAQVNSKLVLGVPGGHDFGAMLPSDPATTYAGNVNVRSNVTYQLGRVLTTSTFQSGVLSVTDVAGLDGATWNSAAPAAAGQNYSQTWTVDPGLGGTSWALPGTFSATYTYTATPSS